MGYVATQIFSIVLLPEHGSSMYYRYMHARYNNIWLDLVPVPTPSHHHWKHVKCSLDNPFATLLQPKCSPRVSRSAYLLTELQSQRCFLQIPPTARKLIVLASSLVQDLFQLALHLYPWCALTHAPLACSSAFTRELRKEDTERSAQCLSYILWVSCLVRHLAACLDLQASRSYRLFKRWAMRRW